MNTRSSRVKLMSNGLILGADDVKKVLAEYFHVEEKDVIKTQYTYIIKQPDKTDGFEVEQ